MCDNRVGKVVQIISTNKRTYQKQGVLGQQGVIERAGSALIGVRLYNMENESGSSGLFWFSDFEIEFIEEVTNMYENYKYVAGVKLLEDYNQKMYYFALHEDDHKLVKVGGLVVVNPRIQNGRSLGRVCEILTREEYKEKNALHITAEVIGVVNMDRYVQKQEEEKRLKEIEDKKKALHKQIQEKIKKRQNIEFYEKMAEMYKDVDPDLFNAVEELRKLEEEGEHHK